MEKKINLDEDPNLREFLAENRKKTVLAFIVGGSVFVGVSIIGGIGVGLISAAAAGFGSYAFFRYGGH